MNKYKTLKWIIDGLMKFATPSINPDDFGQLEGLCKKILSHYKGK